MFVMAVFEFGKIDAIGHSPFIVILLAIVTDDARDARRHHLWAAEAWYAVAIAGFMAELRLPARTISVAHASNR